MFFRLWCNNRDSACFWCHFRVACQKYAIQLHCCKPRIAGTIILHQFVPPTIADPNSPVIGRTMWTVEIRYAYSTLHEAESKQYWESESRRANANTDDFYKNCWAGAVCRAKNDYDLRTADKSNAKRIWSTLTSCIQSEASFYLWDDYGYCLAWGLHILLQKAIHNHISNIKKKLCTVTSGQQYIVSVHGVGYKFDVTQNNE